MKQDCYFGSVDLSDAYYSIAVCKIDSKYFVFLFTKVKKYQFTALVMGSTSSPRFFTKILQPMFAYLRARGHISTAYIDDSCLLGLTFWEC